jgi:tetratricopeptide (TPR) repeat protein
MLRKKYREVADYLVRAARIHPQDASIQYNLAKALSDSGNDEGAIAHHKKAVALAPAIRRLGLTMEKQPQI